jgi:hypothetical protein
MSDLSTNTWSACEQEFQGCKSLFFLLIPREWFPMNRRVKGRGKIRQLANHPTMPPNLAQQSTESLGVVRRWNFQDRFDLVGVYCNSILAHNVS